MMYDFLTLISEFVFLYPLGMSLLWLLGAIIFYWRRERGKLDLPVLEHYPMYSILVPAHNEEKQIEATVERLLH
ncbi:MAG: hypothetical protein ACE5DZ_01510 [Mariprofundus sp.]